MADNKKYYYLKLKDNFFDREEIKILESMPNGIYYSNLLLKMYLKSIKSEGALKVNDSISYDEAMLATLTGLSVKHVKSGLKVLSSMKLIEIMEDGTIYLLDIQSYIGKSSSEGDRKKAYREKIEEKRQAGVNPLLYLQPHEDGILKNSGTYCGTISGTNTDKCPPETENRAKFSDIRVIEKERNRDRDRIRIRDNSDAAGLEILTQELLIYFTTLSQDDSGVTSSIIKAAIMNHGHDNVKLAIDKAVEKDKLNITYVKGILRNWEKHGYPPSEDFSEGCFRENRGENKSSRDLQEICD